MLMSRREGLRAKSHVEAPGGTSAGSRNAAGRGFDSPRRLPPGTPHPRRAPTASTLYRIGGGLLPRALDSGTQERAPTRRTGRARSSRAQNGRNLSASLDSACAAPLGQTRRRPSTAGLPDGFGVNPVETIDAYIVEVVCWVRAGAACGRGGESKPDQPGRRGQLAWHGSWL